MPPGKNARARRSALGLDVIVLEADALAGKLVDARRGYCSTVPPEGSPADVVQQDENNVGLLFRCRNFLVWVHSGILSEVRHSNIVSANFFIATPPNLRSQRARQKFISL